MNHYIIDGNNLIGKIKPLMELQSNDRQTSREKIVSMLNQFFAGKKLKVTLHFDGFPNNAINLVKGRVVYSENKTADEQIRSEIDRSKNPKLIVLVTSDNSLLNYGRVCSCKTIKSEEFYREIIKSNHKSEESQQVKILEKENEIFLKLFTKQ
ncbi:MAG: NYN domain-containing protein [Melioribacteraceae bacterium]|nr:NYN domain-containing protein [Melioribacteraceae bacterium]